VFVDWSQNDRHKTTVCAYSLRAQPGPMVSTPLSWDEVSDALDRDETSGLEHDTESALARITDLGDLYEANLFVDQELPVLTPETPGT
jgi:bifunctional non-homologous end joining protein LigD